jgi:P pilus assembly chaperone PapD
MREPIRFIIKISLIFFTFIQLSYGGGILVGQTRVIYDADKKEASLPLSNKSDRNPFLIQSWIESGDTKTRGPFITTPPLFRLNANEDSSLRISYTGSELPKNKESVFYINVRAIPSTPKNSLNELRLIINTRIKLFYRPPGLEGKPYDAYKLLQFSRTSGELRIKNPTPFYVVFSYLMVGNTLFKDVEMVAPGGELTVKLPESNHSNTIEWSAINDYGGDSRPEKRALKPQ